MNNFKWIKEESNLKSLGYYLCDLYDGKNADCDKCPVTELCSPGNNGYVEWLRTEHPKAKENIYYGDSMKQNTNQNEKLKIGDVLWQIRGIEQNGVYKYNAHPLAIEVIDDHKIIFSDGTGGSRNLLGQKWFYTRDEALDNFKDKFEKISAEATLSLNLDEDQIEHRERTDFQDYEVCRFDTVNETSVYAGGLNRLVNITDKLSWHKEYFDSLYMDIETLTLSEIWEQAKEFSEDRILTVFEDSPLKGTIYQCGNYEEGKWVKLGNTMGYA